MSKIYQENNNIFMRDLKLVSQVPFINWDKLANKNIMITGATGLIGYNLVNALLYANEVKNLGLKVIALVRNIERAKIRFDDLENDDALIFVEGSIEALPNINIHIDYIIHGASQTSSKAFVDKPVETILTALNGTINLLEFAKNEHVLGFTYLSSMEVYGYPERGHKVSEGDVCQLSSLDVRNSYPISKLQCENLCHAYAKEYGLKTTICRLTQTFGVGVESNDSRIFAYLGRCVQGKHDIVLKTKGETERSYLYTADAVTAILTILLQGENGQAYNIADENTYCSIRQMAEMLAKQHGINVVYDIQDEKTNGYLSTLYMDLDTSALKSLGWHVLKYGNTRLITDMINDMTAVWNK